MRGITFGTDGFRGIIAEDFTFASVERVARAYAVFLRALKKNRRPVVVGYDRRFLSDEFARHFSRTLALAGIAVWLTKEPVPTPAVSYCIRQNRLAGGVIITASHNPPRFNGIKLKDENGTSAAERVTREIERLANSTLPGRQKSGRPAAITLVDIIPAYIAYVRSYLQWPLLQKSRFCILVDPMYGVGSGLVDLVLKGSACRVSSIHGEHNPLFGGVNPEPIERYLTELPRAVKRGQYDVALALDGDADRIGAMCPDGRFINSHMAICLLLVHLIEGRRQSGSVVKSLNTTTMVDKIARHFHLPLIEVAVGFKHIAQLMQTQDILLGGEESGGIGFKGYMPERDGVVAGLLLVEMMAQRRQSLAAIVRDLERRFGRYVYARRDVTVERRRRIPRPRSILRRRVVEIKDYDGVKFILDDESWLLVRASGTEPIVRIYAESSQPRLTQQLLTAGQAMV